MGTDVHIIVERRFGEKWIGVWASDYLPEEWWDHKDVNPSTLTDRHYRRFNKIAGVRGEMDGPSPRGLPEDASELSRAVIEEHGFHSATWWSLVDAQTIYNMPDTQYVGQEPRAITFEHFVQLVWSDDDAEPYRVIFAFDS